jgi:dihydrofolate synthase/folylpolyglutamate synthase
VATTLTWAAPSEAGRPVQLALNGVHQNQNAAVAVDVLRRCSCGAAMTDDAIVAALTDVEWPARLEWLRFSSGDVLLDAAHNPAGAAALAEYVLAAVGPLPLVCSVMRDKDVSAIVRALSPAVSRYVTTTAPSPRALAAQELAELVRAAVPDVAVDCHDDPMAAVREALRSAPRAMVAGSIFLVGPVRAQLMAQRAATVRYPSNSSPFFLD